MSLSHVAETIDAARPVPEYPVTTQDGVIWPKARAEMSDRKAVFRRMTDDAARLLVAAGDEGVLTERDFRRLGWTRPQIDTHGALAIDKARHSGRLAC